MVKNNYIIENIKLVLSNKTLQLFIIGTFLFFGYFFKGLYSDYNLNYFDYLSLRLTYQYFLTCCLLPLVLFFNVSLLNLYEKNNMFIIRLKNKRKYLKDLTKNIFIADTFIFVVILATVITFQNFTFKGNLTNEYNDVTKTTAIIYAIFTILKLYFLTIITGIVQIFSFKLFKKGIAFVISFGLIGSVYLCDLIKINTITTFLKFPKYFGFYMIDNVRYSSFALYVYCFLLYMFALIFVLLLIYKITIKHMRGISE